MNQLNISVQLWNLIKCRDEGLISWDEFLELASKID